MHPEDQTIYQVRQWTGLCWYHNLVYYETLDQARKALDEQVEKHRAKNGPVGCHLLVEIKTKVLEQV